MSVMHEEMASEDLCPQCGTSRLRSWRELTEDERNVVRRLSADAPEASRWCGRCWYEERDTHPRMV